MERAIEDRSAAGDAEQQAYGEIFTDIPESNQWYIRGMIDAFRIQAEQAKEPA